MNTVARSLLAVVWELISRIVTTFMLFGVFETVSSKLFFNYNFVLINPILQVGQITSSVTPLSVWEFASSSVLYEIMVFRFVMATFFVIVFYPALIALGPLGVELLSNV